MIFKSINVWIVFLLLIFVLSCTQKNESNLNFVDPAIGGVGVILEPTRVSGALLTTTHYLRKWAAPIYREAGVSSRA